MPPTCTVTGTLYDGTATAVTGTLVYYRLVRPPPTVGFAYTGKTQSVAVDGSGSFSVTCFQNAEYQFWVGSGERVTVVTANTSLSSAILVGATILPVSDAHWFQAGWEVSVGPDGSGAQETVEILAVSISQKTLTVAATAHAHASGAPVGIASIPCPPLIGGQTP